MIKNIHDLKCNLSSSRDNRVVVRILLSLYNSKKKKTNILYTRFYSIINKRDKSIIS